MRILCFILASTGAAIMAFTIFHYCRIVKLYMQNLSTSARKKRGTLFFKWAPIVTMSFFVIGYLVGAMDLVRREVDPIIYFIIIIFFVGGVFIYSLVLSLANLARSIKEKNDELIMALLQIENHNAKLQEEIDRRVQEIVTQDHMLLTVNNIASILLTFDMDRFDEALWSCMGILAQSGKADRVYVWKNYERDGTFYTKQLYEWSEDAEPQQGKATTIEIPLSTMAGELEEKMRKGQCVNGIVKTFSKAARDHLFPQGIVSILMAPVFLRGDFWGFVGFDDCHNERVFSQDEERMLQSSSLLIVNALLRNEVMENLVQAREEALSSTRAKTDFLANISHEIRTPINAITGMTAIARKATDLDKINDCLIKIDAASRQLLGLINDVLDMSKIEANRLELENRPFDIFRAMSNIRSIVGVRAAEKQQSLRMDIDPSVPRIAVGDEMRLSQVLLNLLSNAIKFTPEKGMIDVSVKCLSAGVGRNEFEISVKDSGIGMTAEQQGRLFMKFEQADRGIARRFGGTGRGLAISKNIVEMMGGSIGVTSEESCGSCFTIRFWMGAGSDAMLNTQGDECAQEYSFHGQTALLVEDVEINREIVIEVLKKTGIAIDCAENGKIALEMFSANPTRYDIVFMDIQMPVMDGYTATIELRALPFPRAKEVPILAMTANAFSDDVEKCERVGMNGHISKPINFDSLSRITASYLQDTKK